MSNLSGTTILVQREELKCGIYFIYLLQNNKTITTQKLIITN